MRETRKKIVLEEEIRKAWKSETTCIVFNFNTYKTIILYDNVAYLLTFDETTIILLAMMAALEGGNMCPDEYVHVAYSEYQHFIGKRKGIEKAMGFFGLNKEAMNQKIKTPYDWFVIL